MNYIHACIIGVLCNFTRTRRTHPPTSAYLAGHKTTSSYRSHTAVIPLSYRSHTRRRSASSTTAHTSSNLICPVTNAHSTCRARPLCVMSPCSCRVSMSAINAHRNSSSITMLCIDAIYIPALCTLYVTYACAFRHVGWCVLGAVACGRGG